MNRRVVLGVLVTLLVVAAVASVGFYAYSWGVAQGSLQNTQIVVPDGDGVVTAPVYPYGAPFYHYGRGFGRWGGGFGFGPLGCLFPILGFFLLFGLFRLIFWGGGWRRHGWGGPGHYSGGQGAFEEWHRRAHGEAEAPKSE